MLRVATCAIQPDRAATAAEFRVEGHFRDIPLPVYVAETLDKHVVAHRTTSDGYLLKGRRPKT